MSNVDFRVVPQPMSGAQSAQMVGQGLAGFQPVADKMAAEKEAMRPVNPLQQQMIDVMLKYTQRIKAGEDPARVTDEAKQDPIILQYKQSQSGGGLAAPAMGAPQGGPPMGGAPQRPTYPDVGMQGGRPQMGQPGQFDPTRGPPPGQSLGAPPQGMQGPQQAPQQAPMPQGPNVSGAMDMSPSLGGGQFDQLSAAPGMPGASQPPRQEFGAQPQPSMGQAPAPRPAPQAPAPYAYNQRDYAQAAPMFPTVLAANGREQAATVQADARLNVQQSRDNTNTFIAILKSQGTDGDRALKEAVEFSKLDVSQQQNVLNNATKLQTAEMGANSRLGAAQIGAGSRERVAGQKQEATGGQGLEKELIAVTKAQNDLVKQPMWFKDPASVEAYGQMTARMEELRNAAGRPSGFAQPGSSPRPAAPKAAPKGTPGSLSSQDQAALSWANKNPSDPRAKAIKQKLGR